MTRFQLPGVEIWVTIPLSNNVKHQNTAVFQINCPVSMEVKGMMLLMVSESGHKFFLRLSELCQ